MSESTPALLDAALVKARRGDRQAFEVLVRAHQRSVYSLALRMLGTADRAEDLAQEVFMQMHDKLTTLGSSSHLSFWLRKVTTHRAIDRLRRPAPESTSLDGIAEPSIHDEGDPLLQRQLRSLVLRLSPDARAVVTLRYQEDLDPVDIAATLDMPLNTVKSHLKRSLDSLRASITGGSSTCAAAHSAEDRTP